MSISAIFIDRDGVINRNASEHDYIKSWDEFHFYTNAISALKRITEKKIPIFVISNQRGIARGLMSGQDLNNIHENMIKKLINNNAIVSGIYYCPHDKKDLCNCRKPAPGMITQAATENNIDLANSFMIGDSRDDIEAGKRAGCKTVFVLTGRGRSQSINMKDWTHCPDHIARNLLSAALYILNNYS